MTTRCAVAGRVGLSWIVAIVLAGCLGDSATPSPSPTPAALQTAVVTTYPLETTVWVEGLVVTVHYATASLDVKGGPVTVSMRIANPGSEPASLSVPPRLAASGAVFTVVSGTVLPEVVAGASEEISLVFDVEGRSSIEDGVLRIGRPGDHQAKIPFTRGAVPALTLEPQPGVLSAAVTAGDLRLALRHREVRWDLPDWYQELPMTTEALTLIYDVTYVGTFTGGFAFTGANVVLRLPNGTLVGPRQDGHSQSLVVIGAGKTARSLTSRFEIPTGTTGTIGLVISDGLVRQTATFKIGP